MKQEWTKMPDGRRVRSVPDALEMLLAESDLAAATSSTINYGTADTVAAAGDHPRSYGTEAFDIRKLAGSEISILGSGSVGSYLSYFLGPARLVQNVIDFKTVERRHTEGGRTIYDPLLIGLKKVDALKSKIEREHIGTIVNPYPYNVAEIPDIEFSLMFSRSMLVFLAIDDPAQILRISDLAYPIVELLQVAMHAAALSGHVAVTVPYTTPCLRCTLDINNPADIHRLDGEPGSSLHITRVAHEAAAMGIEIMYSKLTGEAITRRDTAKNLIYIANAKQELSPDGPGLRFEGSRKRPGCPVCNP